MEDDLSIDPPLYGAERTGDPGPDQPARPLDKGRLAKVSTIVAAGTLASRVTGLIRVILTAAALGDGLTADAYNLANVAPNIVYELLIGGVLSATLVPLFVRADQRRDQDGPSAVMSLAFGALVALTSLSVMAAPLLARMYGSGSGERHDLLVTFLYLILPEVFFYGLTALLTAALHARRRFVAAAVAPVLNNVVVIAVMAFVAVRYGECRSLPGGGCDTITTVGDHLSGQWVVGIGTMAGIAAMSFVLIPAVRHAGIHWRWSPNRHDPMIRELVRLAGWTVGYVAANQIALFIVLRLANGAAEGTVTAYQVAFVFFQLPHGLIAVTVMTTFLPELSAAAARRDLPAYRRRFGTGLRLMMAPLMSATALLFVFAGPLADIALDHGAFDQQAADVVGDTVRWLALGLPAFSLFLYCCRGFYALEDTKTPFQVNAVECAVNIGAALVLVHWGAPGLGGAYALSYVVAAVLAVRMLHRAVRFGGDELRDTASGLLGSLVLALAVGLAGWSTVIGLGGGESLPVLLGAGVAAGITFLVGGFAWDLDGFVDARHALEARGWWFTSRRGDRSGPPA
jgi:putative peptidoglycan lipid II flippase